MFPCSATTKFEKYHGKNIIRLLKNVMIGNTNNGSRYTILEYLILFFVCETQSCKI